MSTEISSHSSLDSRLSLLIPTKDRAAFLARLLGFYASRRLGCPIAIGDASSDPSQRQNNQQAVARYGDRLRIAYDAHPSGATTVTSVHRMLEAVRTPYAVLCGDDDFLIPELLAACVRFLEGHPDTACVTGDQAEAFVHPNGDKGLVVTRVVPGAHKEASHPLPSRRLLQWAVPAIGKNTFAVQPTEVFRWAWGETTPLGLDTKLYAPLHELSVNVLTVIRGKQRHLRGLYHLMLRHTDKTGFSGPLDYFDRVAHWDWPAKVVPTLDRWALEITQREPIALEAARRVAQTVFLQWLIPYLARNRDRKLEAVGLPPVARATLRQRLAQTEWAKAVRGLPGRSSLRRILDGGVG